MSAIPLSMTPDQRDAAIDDVNRYWSSIDTGDLATDNQLLLAYVRTRTTEFADADVSPDGMIWARFIDGLSTVFVTKTVPPGTVLPTAAISSALMPAVKRLAEIPKGDRAVLIDVDKLAAGSLTTIAPALTKKGYAVTRPNGTVDDFLVIQDVSVLFISSHGYYDVTKAGTPTYVIMTNERTVKFDPTNARLVSLRAMSDAGEIIVTSARWRDTNGGLISSQPAKFFSITEQFVQRNWTFTQNSLVVVDACDMFRDQRLNDAAKKAPYANFRAALQNKNAGTLLGWDEEVSPIFASNVMQLFFDRVLGANAYQPETPKQRPFPYVPVYDWLVSTNQHSETGGGTLRMQYPQAIPGQLAPTIQRTSIYNPAEGEPHAGAWVLEISGDFGRDVGVVSVDGTALALLESWNQDILYAALPPSMNGPGSHGDLLVTVRNHESNAVPLTKWAGNVSQVQIDSGLGVGARLDISCPVQGTADVHAARNEPAQDPQRIHTLILESNGSCTYAHSGTWFEGSTRYDLSGSGTVAPSADFEVLGAFRYTGGSAALPVQLQGGMLPVLSMPGTLRITETSNGSSYVTSVNGNWIPAIGNVTLGSKYNLTGSLTCLGASTCTETWSLTPAAAPTPDTES